MHAHSSLCILARDTIQFMLDTDKARSSILLYSSTPTSK